MALIKKEHVCKRCLYTTDQKANMRLHLSRKNPCLVNSEIGGQEIDIKELYDALGDIRSRKHNVECLFCNKLFSCAASLSRHKKKCVAKNTTKDVIHNTNHVTFNTQNNGNMIQVNINAIGQENISFLKPEFLAHCIHNAMSIGIPKLIEKVHMNHEHPENHNIRGKSMRMNTLETWDGRQWNLTPASSVLDDLIHKGCKVIYRHYYQNIEKEEFKDQDIQNIIQTNMATLTDVSKKRKSEVYYKIRKSLFYMFFKERPEEYAFIADPDGKDGLVEDTLNALSKTQE